MTARASRCGGCGTPADPVARFCSDCGRILAASATEGRPDATPRARPDGTLRARPDGDGNRRVARPGRPRRRGIAGLLVTLLVLAGGVALVTDTDGDAGPTATGRDEPGPDAPQPGGGVDVDVGPGRDAAPMETVGGLACRGPDGPVACVAHLTELDLADDDEVRMIRGRIVVAGGDGTVSAHRLRDGERRWRADFEPPVTVHTDVADAIAVTDAQALHVVDLVSGGRVGRIDVVARQVATIGPWLVLDDGERIGAFGVTGQPGWTRALDGAWALLTSSGSFLQTQDALQPLFGNTGRARFEAAVSDVVDAAIQPGGDVDVVSDDPPAVRTIRPDGDIRSRTSLPGEHLAWASFSPDGQRLAAVTVDDAGRLQWLTIVDRHQPGPPRHIPLSGRPSELDPVIDDRVLLLPTRGVVDLLVVDLASRSVVDRVDAERPLTDVGPAGEHGFATIDDLGTLRVQGIGTDAPAYTVPLDPRAHLLQAQPLVVRTDRAVVTFADPTQGRGTDS